MRTKLLYIIILYSLSSCVQLSEDENIDIEKTEKLIPLLERLDFSKLELKDGRLIINDTLIKFDSDTSKNRDIFIADSTSAEMWTKSHKLSTEKLEILKNRILESKNNRINKEDDIYFFSEGGWIDSNYGKAYSKSIINNNKKNYKFNRIQSINPIKEKPNWYIYYAD